MCSQALDKYETKQKYSQAQGKYETKGTVLMHVSTVYTYRRKSTMRRGMDPWEENLE